MSSQVVVPSNNIVVPESPLDTSLKALKHPDHVPVDIGPLVLHLRKAIPSKKKDMFGPLNQDIVLIEDFVHLDLYTFDNKDENRVLVIEVKQIAPNGDFEKANGGQLTNLYKSDGGKMTSDEDGTRYNHRAMIVWLSGAGEKRVGKDGKLYEVKWFDPAYYSVRCKDVEHPVGAWMAKKKAHRNTIFDLITNFYKFGELPYASKQDLQNIPSKAVH